jgi:hypothetical protein
VYAFFWLCTLSITDLYIFWLCTGVTLLLLQLLAYLVAFCMLVRNISKRDDMDEHASAQVELETMRVKTGLVYYCYKSLYLLNVDVIKFA